MLSIETLPADPVLFCCGSMLPVCGARGFGDVSPYVCSYYFSSVSVAERPSFGKSCSLG